MDVNLGQVVYSIAGRDSGRVLVVVEIIDDNNVLVSDGDLRPIEKAKKKKKKHLKVTEKVILPLNEKFRTGERVSNSEIRKAITQLEINRCKT